MTYSFQEAVVTVSHPLFGQYSFVGQGIGSVDIDYANDASAHDLAADGTVMTSKIKADNGTVAINIQQTSSGNTWLTNLFKSLKIAAASAWNDLTITVSVPSISESTVCSRCCFQKNATRSYQAQGQQKTWNFMSESIQMN